MQENKQCTCCMDIKLLTEYHKDKQSKDRLRNFCKTCVSDKYKVWLNKNRELRAAYKKEWQQENKSHIAKYKKEWQADNDDKLRANSARYYENNKEKVIATNSKYILERRKNNKFIELKDRLRKNVSMSLRAKGYTKKHRSYELLGADYNTVWNYLIKGWEDRYGKPFKKTDKYDIHHDVECNAATNEEELIELMHHTNLELLTPEDHRKLHQLRKKALKDSRK